MATPPSDVPPNSFAVTNIATILEWHCTVENLVKHLGCKGTSGSCRIAIDINLETTDQKLMLDLRVPVEIKEFSRTTYLHLLIRPEHIVSLDCKRSVISTAPDRVRTTFVQRHESASSKDVTTLSFSTNRPPTLIGPSELCNITPKTKKTRDVLDKLQSFAQHATNFTIYLPGEAISEERIQAVCAMATTATSDMLPLERMYGGKGGRVQSCEDLDTSPPYDPPSYDEIGPTPSPPAQQDKRKRRLPPRAPASPAKVIKVTHTDPDWDALKKDMVAVRAAIEELKREKAECVSDFGIPAVEPARAEEETTTGAANAVDRSNIADCPGSATNTRLEGFSQRLDTLESRLSGMDERCSARVADLEEVFTKRLEEAELRHEQRLLQAVERFNNRFVESEQWFEKRSEQLWDDVKADTEDAIASADIRWEEELAGEKDELRDFVKEEIQNVEETIKGDLRGGKATVYVDWQ